VKENGRILLFIPNTRWYGKRPWFIIPHSALILTSILKGEFDYHILDANAQNLDERECSEKIKALNPALFLVSGVSVEYFEQYHKAFELAKGACPGCTTVFGGIYPTIMGWEAMEDANIDFVFLGYAEGRAVPFLACLLKRDIEQIREMEGVGYRDRGEVTINPMAKFLYELDTQERAVKPDYSFLNVDFYLDQAGKEYNYSFPGKTAILLTSYGCKYNCVFCATRTLRGKGIVFRPMEDVLEEIEWLMAHHGVQHLSFLDECFLADRKRTEAIMTTIIQRNLNLTWKMPNVSAWHLDGALLELMKASGCTMICVSVESGSDRVLHEVIHKPLRLEMFAPIIKKCHELGIDIAANFVIGLPGETWDEIRQTFAFADESGFDLCSFHIATPYPKTALYATAKKNGYLPNDFDFRNPKFFGTSQGFITTEEFTPFELMVLRAFEWDRINFKNNAKTVKIARMMNMTEDQLDVHRKQTRKKLGVHH